MLCASPYLQHQEETAMPQNATTCRSTNINIRVAPKQRDLIDHAASLSSKTRTEFILNAVTRAAEEAILDQTLFQMSPAQLEDFQKALDRPPLPNNRLAELLTRTPRWDR